LSTISDRIVDRELSDETEIKRQRIIGRRLKEGYAHYKRYMEILNSFSKHGFGYLFERIKKSDLLPGFDGPKEDVHGYPEARRLRMVFEELGPTFIKIGQILSTRPDLVPGPYLDEFEKLRDSVAPMGFTTVRGIIEKELGVNPEQITPTASFIDDLGADSLDIVELVMAMEEAFGTDIPDEDAEKIQTVKDAIDYVEQRLS